MTFASTGWAARSHESTDLDEAAAAAAADFLDGLPKADGFETWDVRRSNGQTHVWLAGFRNHRQDRVLDAYRQLARLAPGSYGVLYILNDELNGDAGNEWQRWVMVRGTVNVEQDNSLSAGRAACTSPSGLLGPGAVLPKTGNKQRTAGRDG